MLTEKIKKDISKIFQMTPDDVSVAYGKKTKNNIETGELCIILMVKEKKPLSELSSDEILPKTISVEDETYLTDVQEIGEINTLVCDSNTLTKCYDWQTTEPINRDYYNPILGGMSVTSSNLNGFGTMGLIAVDNTTNALVGVTNAHVLIEDIFYTQYRDLQSIIENELTDVVYEPSTPNLTIGRVLKYYPFHTFNSGLSNYIDCAIFSVSSAVTSNSISYKQVGLSYSSPMEFATTAEIDSLLTTNPVIYNSGARTGPKETSPCNLRITSLFYTVPVKYKLQNFTKVALFEDLIVFKRENPDCPYPTAQGDSGSALIANFGGTSKILGLIFAGGPTQGYACRIDRIASMMNISAWDGSPKGFIDDNSISYKTVVGGSLSNSITCSGKTYYQVGLTYNQSPC
jgi:hypothetical protein